MRYELGGGGAYIWRRLYMEGLIFGILRYLLLSPSLFLRHPMFMNVLTAILVLPQSLTIEGGMVSSFVERLWRLDQTGRFFFLIWIHAFAFF